MIGWITKFAGNVHQGTQRGLIILENKILTGFFYSNKCEIYIEKEK